MAARCVRPRAIWAASGLTAALGLALPAAAPAAGTGTVSAGSLRAVVSASPWRVTLMDRERRVVLATRTGGTAAGPDGALGFRAGGRWYHATRAVSRVPAARRSSRRSPPTTPPAAASPCTWRPTPAASSRSGPRSRAPAVAAVEATGAAFGARAGERYLGFGERSNAVDQRGGHGRQLRLRRSLRAGRPRAARGRHPAAGLRPARRRHATSRCPGCSPRAATACSWTTTSAVTHHLGGPARLERRGRRGAPRPAGLRRAAARGRPAPHDRPRRATAAARRRRSTSARGSSRRATRSRTPPRSGPPMRPASVAMTYAHYLPCGVDAAGRAAERAKTAALHAAGLASTTYVNPMICTSLHAGLRPRGRRPGCSDARRPGTPYVYRYFTEPLLRRRAVRLLRPRGGRLLRRAAGRGRPRRPRRLDGGLRGVHAARLALGRRDAAAWPCTTATRSSTTAPAWAFARRAAPPARPLQPLGVDGRGALLADRLGRRPDRRTGATTGSRPRSATA